MRYLADLEIHSRFARACSPSISLESLLYWGKLKGLDIIGTGDCTHPRWLKECKEKLKEVNPGFFKLKDVSSAEDAPYFILSGEVSLIYSQGGKVRRIHLLIYLPDMESAEGVIRELSVYGKLESDGRPIIGMQAKSFTRIILEKGGVVVPAHIWTPWFGLFGSMSGFDSLEECFGELTPYIRAIETGLSCYDEETEVLTEDGWKKFNQINGKEKICTLDIQRNEIEFQKPKKIYRYSYRGKMYRLKTKRADLLVTPNHNLFISGCDFRKPPVFHLETAESLFGKSKRFKKDGIWIGESPAYFVLPVVNIKHGSRYYSGCRTIKEKHFPIKQWLKFFGFWIAEGWTTGGKHGDYEVYIANNDSDLLSEMRTILGGFGYNVYYDKKAKNTIRVRNYQLFSYLKQFGKCYNKFVPPMVKSLSKELLEIFLEYYIKGDGHRYGRSGKGLSATTTSVRLRDDLQEVALKVGMSAYYKLHNKKGTPFKNHDQKYKKVYKQRNNSWNVFFIRKNIHTVLPSVIKKYKYVEAWVDFDGRVFCVSVPNRVIYIRRNGVPLWCGNSDPVMNWRIKDLDKVNIVSFSDMHSAQPHRMGREATIFELARPSWENLMRAVKDGDANDHIDATVEFFPEEGRYHYDGHRSCGIRFTPKESISNDYLCPVCQRPLTLGVMHRVEILSQREQVEQSGRLQNGQPYYFIEGKPKFFRIIPLAEIIANGLNSQPTTKKVLDQYEEVVRFFGNEFKMWFEATSEEIMKVSQIAGEGISNMREGKIKIEPGYDGEYGKLQIFGASEQKGLF